MSLHGSTSKRILISFVAIMLSIASTAASTTKRGIPFNNTATLPSFEHGKVSWCYNWWSNNNGQSTGNLEYVPMLKGTDARFTNSWVKDVNSLGGSEYLLSFNEPDINNINPSTGASVYKTYMSGKFPGKYLGAPALTNADSTFTWWKEFLADCAECVIDFWPVHWYDEVNNGAYFQKFVNEAVAFAAKSGKGQKIWLTEIGFRGSPSQAAMNSFLQAQLPFLDSHPMVGRYSFTATTDDGLDMLSHGQMGTLMTTGNTYTSS